jgi:ribosomal protein S18 acetylase RimI-like enzyme
MARGDDILNGYRGHVDAVEPVLSGWVTEIADPAASVAFIVSVDLSHRIPVIADRKREDVATAGLASPNCGFAVELPADVLDGAEHQIALLLSDGRSLNLPGYPPSLALGPVRADLVPAASAGVDSVADLLRRTDSEAGFDPDLIGIEHAAAFNALQAPDRGFLFYAQVGARLVGYGRLDRGRDDASVFGVVALTVLEAYRRKGIGEALMRALLRGAASSGLSEVWLSVRPDNTPAVRLYEKLGFVPDASRPWGQWAVPGEVTMVCPQRRR